MKWLVKIFRRKKLNADRFALRDVIGIVWRRMGSTLLFYHHYGECHPGAPGAPNAAADAPGRELRECTAGNGPNGAQSRGAGTGTRPNWLKGG